MIDSLFSAALHSPAPLFREELYKICLLIAAKHKTHAWYLGNRLSLKLSIAAGHHHESAGVLPHKFVYRLTAFVVGHFSNATSVNHAKVGLLTLVNGANAHFLQHLAESGSLGEIQLTA